MGNLINSGGGGELTFRGKQNSDINAAFLAFLRVLRSKTGKKKPTSQVRRLAPEHLELITPPPVDPFFRRNFISRA